MLWRDQAGWCSRCNTTKKVDDNSYKINSLTRRGQPIATDRDADDVSIHIVKSGQSLEHCNGIENSRLAIIHVGPSLFGVKCTKIHVDAPAKITLKRAHSQILHQVQGLRPTQSLLVRAPHLRGHVGRQHLRQLVILEATLQELLFRQTSIIVLVHPET